MTLNPTTTRLCECGCGLPTRIAKWSGSGRTKGQPQRFINGHNRRGKGEKVFYKNQGRWYVYGRDWKDRNNAWARIIMRNHIGRELTDEEVVHHINGDCSDDRIENLKLYSSQKEHMEVEHISTHARNMLKWALSKLSTDEIKDELEKWNLTLQTA